LENKRDEINRLILPYLYTKTAEKGNMKDGGQGRGSFVCPARLLAVFA
jgi:hypothetical protein